MNFMLAVGQDCVSLQKAFTQLAMIEQALTSYYQSGQNSIIQRTFDKSDTRLYPDLSSFIHNQPQKREHETLTLQNNMLVSKSA